METLRSYVTARKLPPRLKERIMLFHAHLHHAQKEVEDTPLIQALPDHLKRGILGYETQIHNIFSVAKYSH